MDAREGVLSLDTPRAVQVRPDAWGVWAAEGICRGYCNRPEKAGRLHLPTNAIENITIRLCRRNGCRLDPLAIKITLRSGNLHEDQFHVPV